MSGIELVLAFLAGFVMGGAPDRFVLPLVDAWIDQLRRQRGVGPRGPRRRRDLGGTVLAQVAGITIDEDSPSGRR